jgi:hypothetical protein
LITSLALLFKPLSIICRLLALLILVEPNFRYNITNFHFVYLFTLSNLSIKNNKISNWNELIYTKELIPIIKRGPQLTKSSSKFPPKSTGSALLMPHILHMAHVRGVKRRRPTSRHQISWTSCALSLSGSQSTPTCKSTDLLIGSINEKSADAPPDVRDDGEIAHTRTLAHLQTISGSIISSKQLSTSEKSP